ncbi:MAG: tetratricopeptide repeat protein [Polyangiaceae bacterium]
MQRRTRPPRSGGSSSNDNNVIHVDFARRARVDSAVEPLPTSDGQASSPGDFDGDQTPAVEELFSQEEAARLVGLGVEQLRSLRRFAAPTGPKRGRARAYTFRDLIVLRAVAGLLARDVKVRDLTAVVRALRQMLPTVDHPLAELRVVSDGKTISVRLPSGAIEPISGQMLIDFDTRELHDEVVRRLHPRPVAAPPAERDPQRALALCSEANELDENAATMHRAEILYRRALELDPTLAIAHTNLGNIKFRQGDDDEAMVHYRRALSIDPYQAEAQYNLGYVLLDRGRPHEAVKYLQGATRRDPTFADAHFYLAVACETLGERAKARQAWQLSRARAFGAMG